MILKQNQSQFITSSNRAVFTNASSRWVIDLFSARYRSESSPLKIGFSSMLSSSYISSFSCLNKGKKLGAPAKKFDFGSLYFFLAHSVWQRRCVKSKQKRLTMELENRISTCYILEVEWSGTLSLGSVPILSFLLLYTTRISTKKQWESSTPVWD